MKPMAAPEKGSGGEVIALLNTLIEKEKNRSWFIYRVSRPSLTSDKVFIDAGMFPYYPLIEVKTKDSRGKTRTIRKPKLLNYIFVLATDRDVERLRFSDNHLYLYPLSRHLSQKELEAIRAQKNDGTKPLETIWQKVRPEEVHRFIRFNAGYDGEISLVAPDNELLDKGDIVEIINGPFKGYEGVLKTSERRSGGSVYIKLTSFLGAETLHMKDIDLKVKRFGKGSKHFYTKMDSFEKVLLDAAADCRSHGQLFVSDSTLRGKIAFLLHRYDSLEELSRVNEARLNTICYVAATLLNDQREADSYLAKWQRMKKLPESSLAYMAKWQEHLAELNGKD